MIPSISEFSGSSIYLDTMAPYALLRGIDPLAKALFSCIERGDIAAYTSVLTFDELAYRLLLALIKDQYGGSPLDWLHRDEEQMIAQFSSDVVFHLKRIRLFRHLHLLDVTAADLTGMTEAMQRYHLRPRDALHLAAMQKADCFDLASDDHHFDRVPTVRRFTLRSEPVPTPGDEPPMLSDQ